MTNVIACCKWVVDEADIQIADDLAVDTSRAQGKISDFDKSAIEAAVQVAEATGATPLALTYGTDSVKSSFKDVLSRGPEKLYWVASEAAAEADGRATASVLSAAVRKIGDVSLVVCAEGSNDVYARQVGPRIGAVLDVPVVTSVVEMSVEGDVLRAQRKLDDAMQTVEVKLPAVACVLAEGFEPRVPGLRAIMGAGKKPNEQLDVAALGANEEPAARRAQLRGYVMERKNLIVAEDDLAKAAEELAGILRTEGVL